MRETLTISLSAEMGRYVRSAVKGGKYSSTSEFFRDLVRRHDTEQLVRAVKISEQEFGAGRGRILKGSLKALR